MITVQPIRVVIPKTQMPTKAKPAPQIQDTYLQSVAIVVTVHGRPEVVRDCLDVFHQRTPKPVKIVVVDDASDAYTAAILRDSVQRMHSEGRDAHLLVNLHNLKYTKTINRGFSFAYSLGVEWALALNSDVLVTEGWIERMLAAGLSDPKIGIVCPYMSNAALLTVPMAVGSNYRDTAERLSAVAPDRLPPAVTPVGACMMVRRALWEQLGPFDESEYPEGYGEECALWARAVDVEEAKKEGRETWRCVVAPSAYVFHESHASFAESAKRREKEAVERFKARWGRTLAMQTAAAKTNDPRESLTEQVTRVNCSDRPRMAFYCRGVVLCGGVLALVNICNQLIEHGIDATIIFEFDEYRDWGRMPARFSPVHLGHSEIKDWVRLGGFDKGIVLATSWSGADFVKLMGNRWRDLTVGAFVQDREDLFRLPNGSLQYTRRNEIQSYLDLVSRFSVVNSSWVASTMHRDLGVKPRHYIPIGVDHDLFHPAQRPTDGPIKVLAFSRPSTPRRGYALLAESFRELHKLYGKRIELVTYDQTPGPEVPVRHMGKMPQRKLADLMRTCHILVEPSYTQGWGMPAQEFMSTGGCVVSTDNGGIHNYGIDGRNCKIVKHTSDAIVEAVRDLVEDAALREQMGRTARADIMSLSWRRVGMAWAKLIREHLGQA